MIRRFSLLFTFVSLLFFALLIFFLCLESFPVWKKEGLQFLFGSNWYYRSESFALLPMIYGTFWVSLIALGIAAPIGIGSALFIGEYSGGRARMFLKMLVELLAGIPSVVYGLLGVLVLRTWVSQTFTLQSGDTLLTAGILLAIMILPTIASLGEDAIQGVPRRLREAARAMGLSKVQTIFFAVLPNARVGLLSSCLLALGRALGETIAVFLVVGRADNRLPGTLFSLEPLKEAGQTLTSKLGGSEVNLAYGDPLHWGAICGAALILLLGASTIYLIGEWLIYKRKEVKQGRTNGSPTNNNCIKAT